MMGTLESVGIDDITMTYLRHYLVAKQGATRGNEVFDKLREAASGPFAAIELLDELSEHANSYVALVNHRHEHWSKFGLRANAIRKHVETLNELRAEQIRPLMLACMKSLSPIEVERAFRMFIWWSVRFIVTGTPTGAVEKYYAGRAAELWKGKAIKNAKELANAMAKFVPDDAAFKNAFETIRVSKSYLARYFLRSLENTMKDDQFPENVLNDDGQILTLEHVLPENPSVGWPPIDVETAEHVHRRLGNMTLLRSNANSTAGNKTFDEKKKVYSESSGLLLTKDILAYSSWGLVQINERQVKMASVAIKTWPQQ
jgi:hypothetical protein